MRHTLYKTDIVAWANQQAALLRAGQLTELDLFNIAEEIEDVGKSEQRELANRMAVLLMHLLKWQFQPRFRGASWENTIRHQRNKIHRRLKSTPSLKPLLQDEDWIQDAWEDGVDGASMETGLTNFPETCPWSMELVLTENWLP